LSRDERRRVSSGSASFYLQRLSLITQEARFLLKLRSDEGDFGQLIADGRQAAPLDLKGGLLRFQFRAVGRQRFSPDSELDLFGLEHLSVGLNSRTFLRDLAALAVNVGPVPFDLDLPLIQRRSLGVERVFRGCEFPRLRQGHRCGLGHLLPICLKSRTLRIQRFALRLE
jgi:hypothetical protein